MMPILPRRLNGGKKVNRQESGIALLMVMSTLAVLGIVIADLTYSVQIQQRLAFNFIDGLKAFYLAKSGYKFSLLRLKAYREIQTFLDDPANSVIAGMVPKGIVDRVWSFPFAYPLPVPEGSAPAQTNAIETFNKKSSLEGTYQLNISSESSKMNLNNLLVMQQVANTATGTSTATGTATGTATNTATSTATATSTSTNTSSDIDFKPVVEQTINHLLDDKRTNDREFLELYRPVTGHDVMAVILNYMKPDPELQRSQNNLISQIPPSEYETRQKDYTPKGAPLYSINELHLIPGIDDRIFNLIAPSFTVFSTTGININTATKATIWSLFPKFTEQGINDFLKQRDDPEVGVPFASEEKFWEAIGKTALSSDVNTIKESFQKAGLKLITSERSFRILVSAQVGLATRNIEAYVILDSQTGQNPPTTGNQTPGQTPATNTANGQNPNSQQTAQNSSGNSATGLHLVYWHTF